ncbi:MAG: hypothetical protein FWB77_01255 [Treponema sp.]|nr:hypothetical protein [Treponema sp.]
MKNLLKLIGIIAIIAVVGFTMAACEEEAAEEEIGKLTITGFNFTDNGKFVQANATTADGIYIFAVDSFDADGNAICGVIKNRVVTLSVYEHKDGSFNPYTGSAASVAFDVYIFDTEPEDPFNDPADDTQQITITFRKGIGLTGITPPPPPCVHIWNSDKSGVCTECGVTHSPHVDSDSDNECDICEFDMT